MLGSSKRAAAAVVQCDVSAQRGNVFDICAGRARTSESKVVTREAKKAVTDANGFGFDSSAACDAHDRHAASNKDRARAVPSLTRAGLCWRWGGSCACRFKASTKPVPVLPRPIKSVACLCHILLYFLRRRAQTTSTSLFLLNTPMLSLRILSACTPFASITSTNSPRLTDAVILLHAIAPFLLSNVLLLQCWPLKAWERSS